MTSWSDSAALPPEAFDEAPERLIDRLAALVVARRMEVPAILAIEMHRPLTFLGSQALVLFTPLLAPAFGLSRMEQVTRLLQDPAAIERLLLRIEELAVTRDDHAEESGAAGSGGGSA